jgi:hypothetical protein
MFQNIFILIPRNLTVEKLKNSLKPQHNRPKNKTELKHFLLEI